MDREFHPMFMLFAGFDAMLSSGLERGLGKLATTVAGRARTVSGSEGRRRRSGSQALPQRRRPRARPGSCRLHRSRRGCRVSAAGTAGRLPAVEELELAARDEEGELLGLGLGLVGTRHDGTAQGVVGREHAVVQNGVGPGRRDEGTQPGDEAGDHDRPARLVGKYDSAVVFTHRPQRAEP